MFKSINMIKKDWQLTEYTLALEWIQSMNIKYKWHFVEHFFFQSIKKTQNMSKIYNRSDSILLKNMLTNNFFIVHPKSHKKMRCKKNIWNSLFDFFSFFKNMNFNHKKIIFNKIKPILHETLEFFFSK